MSGVYTAEDSKIIDDAKERLRKLDSAMVAWRGGLLVVTFIFVGILAPFVWVGFRFLSPSEFSKPWDFAILLLIGYLAVELGRAVVWIAGSYYNLRKTRQYLLSALEAVGPTLNAK
jgi:hypothetical protein